MVAMDVETIDSISKMDTYMGEMDKPTELSNIIRIAYGSRKERRQANRDKGLIKLNKRLESFKKHSIGFLEASEAYLEVMPHIIYPTLEMTVQVAPQAVSDINVRIAALERLVSYNLKPNILEELTDLQIKLIAVNTEINRVASLFLDYHSVNSAEDRGFVLFSELANEEFALRASIRININRVDGELAGSIDELGITVYEDTIKELTKSIKEYVVDLYEELVDSKDENLSEELQQQKKLLISFVLIDKD